MLVGGVRKDVGRLSKVPFLGITKVSNFFTKCLHQGSIRMYMEGVDNVHRTFSAAPLAPPCADNVLSFL